MRAFVHEGIEFDQAAGIGAVPNVEDVAYRGAVAWIRPSAFLSLCPPHNELRARAMVGLIEGGRPISMGFLTLQSSAEGFEVVGHEGRHRMAALMKLRGDVPFPVAILPRGGRARHLTNEVVEAIRGSMISERYEGPDERPEGGLFVEGPFFEEIVVGDRRLVFDAPSAPSP